MSKGKLYLFINGKKITDVKTVRLQIHEHEAESGRWKKIIEAIKTWKL